MDNDNMLDDIEHFSTLLESDASGLYGDSTDDALEENAAPKSKGEEDKELRDKLFSQPKVNSLMFEQEDESPVSFKEFFGYQPKRKSMHDRTDERVPREENDMYSGENDMYSGKNDLNNGEDEEETLEKQPQDLDQLYASGSSHLERPESNKLTAQIESLEKSALESKPWHLMGEASGSHRPQDSLLSIPIEAPQTSSAKANAAEMLTEESTKTLEEMIKDRIAKEIFDDPIKVTDVDTLKKKKVYQSLIYHLILSYLIFSHLILSHLISYNLI